jgi:tetratricopeptide (TPR) repeat protein
MQTVIPYLQFGELGRVAKLVCISIIWCGYAAGDPEASQQQLQQLEEQAQEAQQHGDYQAAIRQYQNLLKLRPDLSEERINLALLEHLTGDHAAALADFQFVLKASPQRYVPNLLAGFDLLKLGQPRQALPYLLRAEQLNQKESQPALGLGQAYAALRELDKANSAYYRPSLKEPQNSEAYYGLGVTYLSLSHDVSDRIAKIGPNAPLAQSLLGEAFLDQGRVKDAIAIYQALLDAGSLPNSMCWFLGTAYSRQGKSSSGETEFQRALSQSPDCLGAHLRLASLRLREGDVPAALDQLDRISKVDNAFLKANLATLWQQFKPDELNGVLQTLTEPPSASDADTRSLTASSLKSWLNGDTSYYVANGSPPPRKAEGFPSAARLLARGRFSECESTLKTARKLGSADELRLAECAFSAGDYRVALLPVHPFWRKIAYRCRHFTGERDAPPVSELRRWFSRLGSIPNLLVPISY